MNNSSSLLCSSTDEPGVGDACCCLRQPVHPGWLWRPSQGNLLTPPAAWRAKGKHWASFWCLVLLAGIRASGAVSSACLFWSCVIAAFGVFC